MALAPEIMARGLAFVRYLYENALQQARQAGFRRATALLMFHDAVEMFLVLGLQHHDAYTRRPYAFLDYWSELEKKNVLVTQRGTMQALNQARVNLKHHAIIPSVDTVLEARVHVRDFFDENTPVVFGITFAKVSLAAAISAFPEARSRLEAAETMIRDNNLAAAIAEIAIAFSALLSQHDRSVQDPDDTDVLHGSPLVSELSSWSLGQRGFMRDTGHVDEEVRHFIRSDLDRFARDTAHAIRELHSLARVTWLGLDLPRFARFRALTPQVNRSLGGRYEVLSFRSTELSLEQCHFCFDFVVDSALRLQEGQL